MVNRQQLLTLGLIQKEAYEIWRSINNQPEGYCPLLVEYVNNGTALKIGSLTRSICIADLLMSLDDFSEKFILPMIESQPKAALDKISGILADRGGLEGTGRYGPFIDNACIAQELKETYRQSPGWNKLNAAQKEALDLIAMKVSRILSGDPNYVDNWDDIEGYVRLAKHDWQKDA